MNPNDTHATHRIATPATYNDTPIPAPLQHSTSHQTISEPYSTGIRCLLVGVLRVLSVRCRWLRERGADEQRVLGALGV